MQMLPIILMFITLGILVLGVVFMAMGNKLNLKYSTKLMSLRIITQAVVVLLFALLYYFQRKLF